MSDSTPRTWQFYLDDMIASAEKVIAYSAGLDQPDFVATGCTTMLLSETLN